jgi:hypothetical protein
MNQHMLTGFQGAVIEQTLPGRYRCQRHRCGFDEIQMLRLGGQIAFLDDHIFSIAAVLAIQHGINFIAVPEA